jgi:hypothetical protein
MRKRIRVGSRKTEPQAPLPVFIVKDDDPGLKPGPLVHTRPDLPPPICTVRITEEPLERRVWVEVRYGEQYLREAIDRYDYNIGRVEQVLHDMLALMVARVTQQARERLGNEAGRVLSQIHIRNLGWVGL